ncbi:unnamed protein product [Bubo scandiacus]
MASARPFVCPRAEPRALAQDSPAAGLGAVCPLAKARADLMNFYATTYAVAHGQLRFHPHFGHRTESGYISNNHPTISCLLCPHSAAQGHCQDTATSTTAEHFKPFWLPDGRSLLSRHIQQSGSGYPHRSSLPFLCTGAVSPRHTRLPQGSPKASRKHSTRSCRTGPAQPDVPQKTTIGTEEQSGFTRATPRSDHVLPAQPLSLSITMTDFLPSACSHGSETLPALPAGSERGSGFSQEAQRCLGTATLPAVGSPVVVVSRGLQAPLVTQAGLLGRQVAGRKELSGFTKTHGQYVTPCPTRSTSLTIPSLLDFPAQCWRDPTWMAKNGGIQPQRPSSFSTNNRPTGLGDIVGHHPV